MEEKKHSTVASVFWFAVKLLIAFGVVAYLIVRQHEQLARCFRSFEYRWLIPALFFYGAHLAVCSWRWRKLANILGVPLSGFEALSLTMQGFFFSLVIPGGAIGGDVVKMGVISKRSCSGSKMEGAFTVLMDRIIGMIALFTLALILLVPATPLLLKVELPLFSRASGANWLLIWLIALLCVAGLGASVAIFCHRLLEKLPLIGDLMRWGNKKSGGMVLRLTEATDVYAGNWRELAKLTIISIFCVHLMTIVPIFFLLHGAGVPFHYFDVIVALTIGNIVGLIPLFPGGIGGRDVTVIAILAAAGIDAEAPQLLYTGVILIYNLLGGLFFICDPGRKERAAGTKEVSHE